MPKPITSGEYREAKKTRNLATKTLVYYGGAMNPTGIAAKHYQTFAQRDMEENAKVRLEAHLEQVALKEKARLNRIKSHTGHMNWDALKTGKCPMCDRKLTLQGAMYVCDIHAGPAFRVSEQKLKDKWLTHHGEA
jgi:hypothetical protein